MKPGDPAPALADCEQDFGDVESGDLRNRSLERGDVSDWIAGTWLGVENED